MIQGPHWVPQTKDKVPSWRPYDGETSAPAAFVKTAPVSFQAEFKTDVARIVNCTISATIAGPDGEDVPWGDVAPQTVAFTNGVSSTLSFTAPRQDTLVGAYDVVMNWRALSCQTQSGSIATVPIGTTHHRIYSVFAQPVAPMATPWAKVLEMSSQMLSSSSPDSTAENAVAAIADGIFYSRWTGYDIKFYSPFRQYHYDPGTPWSCGTFTVWTFPLQQYLNELGNSMVPEALKMQCNDNSNLHAILAASQGITALPTLIRDTRPGTDLTLTALYHPAGPAPQCDQVRFTFHQVSSLSLLYDTGQQLISNIEPVLKWLDNTFGAGEWSIYASDRHFDKTFRIAIGQTGRSELVRVRMYRSPSFEGAEKTAALAMSAIPLPGNFSKGAFSGGALGDWSYSDCFQNRHATLRFLRRNVVVWVTYEAASEVLPDKKIRTIPDPLIKGKCEQIAREIDRRLVLLPADGK